jgi:hypothetical protein
MPGPCRYPSIISGGCSGSGGKLGAALQLGTYGKPFIPLGGGVIKCLERGIGGGYGEPAASPARDISPKACYFRCFAALFISMVPLSLSSLADGASRALLWKCVFPHLVAGGALWQVQRHLKQARMNTLFRTRIIENFHFAWVYKVPTNAGCTIG